MARLRAFWHGYTAVLLLGSAGSSFAEERSPAPTPLPVVELEENVYSYEPANNGAGPMWCSGSTCLVRIGTNVFASGLETLKDRKPLNNCRWTLFKRETDGWRLQLADPTARTREPSPLTGFENGKLFLSVNPTLSNAEEGGGPARPEILEFAADNPTKEVRHLLPSWDGNPAFTEHSYRTFCADATRQELLLFQNIGYTHAEWALCDRSGKWVANGKLPWPDGKDYPKPEPIRVCYPNVAMQNRAVYFCGVSDIIEPYPEWRAYKKSLTGKEWDYDFRRLFFTWTADIAAEKFHDWVEIASRDKTCGWLSPGDMWVAADGSVHLVWTERALDERLRAKFYPEEKQSHSLNYAIVVKGRVVLRRTLLLAEEARPGLIAASPRFQVAPGQRLFLVFYVNGSEPDGKAVSENRVMEILPGGETGKTMRLSLQTPFTSYFTATTRAGCSPSATLDMLGQQAGKPTTISYARVRLW
jgi:hypothetical protein